MSDQFWLSEDQLSRISGFFPLSHGVPRVDDRRVVSGIIHVIRNGLRWCDAPDVYGPHKTLYNRFIRWSRMGVFERIFIALAAEGEPPGRLMIDATHLKAHGTASSLLKGGCSPRYGGTKGGLNSKLHAVCDGRGWPVRLLLTEGQQNDHKGAAALLPDLPPAAELIGDRGDDSDGYREALGARGITPCIPPRARRRHPATYCKTSYKQRHKIESLFASLKDWRRIATRYDRCAHAFFSAICIAAVVIFCINQ